MTSASLVAAPPVGSPPEPAGETRLRRLLLLCFLGWYLLCVPLWHETSRVHREPLPDIDAVTAAASAAEQAAFHLPIVVRVVDSELSSNSNNNADLADKLAAELRSQLDALRSSGKRAHANLHWQVSSAAITGQGADASSASGSKLKLSPKSSSPEEVDDALAQLSSSERASNVSAMALPQWQLYVLLQDGGSADKSVPSSPRWVLGRHRHAFTTMSASDSADPASRKERMGNAAALLHALVQAQWCSTPPGQLADNDGTTEGSAATGATASEVGVCAASRSLSQRLSFTLLNDGGDDESLAVPSAPVGGDGAQLLQLQQQQQQHVEWTWNFRAIERAYLSRFMNLLAPFVSFSTDSNVVHYARLTEAHPSPLTNPKKSAAAAAKALPASQMEQDVLGRLPQPLRTHVEQHLVAASSDAAVATSESHRAPQARAQAHVLPSSSLRDIIGTVGGWNPASPLVSSSLEMLAYIPPRQQKPLLFKFPAAAAATDSEQQTKRKKKKGSLHTAALFVPRYGGVAVLNTLPDSCNSSSTVAGTDDDSGACELPASVAQEMMQVFVEQIRQTLGLSQDVAPPNLLCASSGGSSKGGSGACHPGSAPLLLPSPQSGVSSWELDLLAWRLVRLNMAESGALLRSLLLLLEQVPHMPVSAEIQHLVQQALTEQQRTMDLLRGGGGRDDGGAGAHADWRAAGLASQAAVSLAHQAFFHSQLLPALYFPDEHLYAVYLPLFLPITVPLLTGLAAWFAACSMQRKKQKAAAAAAAAAVAVAHASSS